MTPPDRTRIAKLLAMIGSAHDGEALNAARLAHQMIADRGLSWEQFIAVKFINEKIANEAIAKAFQDGRAHAIQEAVKAGLATPAAKQAIQAVRQEGIQEGYARGYKDGQAAPRARPASWQAIVREMLEECSDDLTDWEEGFLENFRRRGWHTPTERQRAVMERIAGKCGIDVPDD